MSDQAASNEQVVDMAQYLRETIAEIDGTVSEWQKKRTGLALRLATLEASTDSRVLAAAADYEERIAANRPYEGATSAQDVISEGLRKALEP